MLQFHVADATQPIVSGKLSQRVIYAQYMTCLIISCGVWPGIVDRTGVGKRYGCVSVCVPHVVGAAGGLDATFKGESSYVHVSFQRRRKL